MNYRDYDEPPDPHDTERVVLLVAVAIVILLAIAGNVS